MKYADRQFGVFQRSDFEGTGIGSRPCSASSCATAGEGSVDEGACFYFSLPDELPA